jgi:hypothetical protein
MRPGNHLDSPDPGESPGELVPVHPNVKSRFDAAYVTFGVDGALTLDGLRERRCRHSEKTEQ